MEVSKSHAIGYRIPRGEAQPDNGTGLGLYRSPFPASRNQGSWSGSPDNKEFDILGPPSRPHLR